MPRVTEPTTRFTVEEYFRMADAGVFRDRRVELLDGRIYRMVHKEPHVIAVTNSLEAIMKYKRPGDWLRVQSTYTLGEHWAPDPDILWLPVPVGTPASEWPAPILVMEISDTTYRQDGRLKLRRYAKARIPEYWILNLPKQQLEIHRDPVSNPALTDCRYGTSAILTGTQSTAPRLRPEAVISAVELLRATVQT